MEKNTCCFTGHRKIPNTLRKKIIENTKKIAEELILQGFCTFFTGGAFGYDLLCSEIILELKKKYPFVKLKIVLPCKDNDKFFPENVKSRYSLVLDKADDVILLSDKYYFAGCMQIRNKYMVNSSSALICFCLQNKGGSFFTKNYAKSKNLTIYDVLDLD